MRTLIEMYGIGIGITIGICDAGPEFGIGQMPNLAVSHTIKFKGITALLYWLRFPIVLSHIFSWFTAAAVQAAFWKYSLFLNQVMYRAWNRIRTM